MRILVTGGAGFIGSNLIHRLIADTPHEVLNLDKLSYAGNPANLAAIEDNPRYRFHQIDICDREAVEAALQSFQPHAIMHLAAESHVDRSIDAAAPFLQTNVVGTYTLLEVCRSFLESQSEEMRERFRFLHTGTDEVFGSLTADDPPFCESTAYAPRSPYAATKASSDHLVRAWFHTHGLPTLVTHCSNNYGPYQFPEKLIPTVILKALRHESVPVYGSGLNVRDWLHVEDHTRALLSVLEKGLPGETYAVGGQSERTNIDLVRDICAILDELAPNPPKDGYASLITFVTDRPGHDHRYAIDSSKIRDELGWKPTHTLENGLRQTVTWYLKSESWWGPLVDRFNDGLPRLGTCERARP